MDLYFDNTFIQSYPIRPNATTYDIWKAIDDWLRPQRINYRVHLKLKDDTIIPINNKAPMNLSLIQNNIDILVVTPLHRLEDLEVLPTDILLQIVSDLPISDINSLCRTSRSLKIKICDNEQFWINKFIKDFGESPVPYKKQRSYAHLYASSLKLSKEIDEYMELYNNAYATAGPLDQIRLDLGKFHHLGKILLKAGQLENLYIVRKIKNLTKPRED